MKEFFESGLRVTLQVNDCFRFEDITAYRLLSSHHLKEMDFGWIDTEKNILWLLEVKDFTRLQKYERLPETLLPAVWLKTETGASIARNLPLSCHTKPPHMKIAFVLKLRKRHQKMYLPILRDELKRQLKGVLQLFDIPDLHLVDHNTAEKLLGWPISVR